IVLSPTNVWAAGHYYTGSVWRTLFLHWNGTAWTPVSSPNLGPSDNFLYDVRAVSPTDIWAVGWYNSGRGFRTLVEHWDGTAWSVVSSPNVGTTLSTLRGSISIISPTDVWATGYYSHGAQTQTLVEHYTNSAPCP